MVQYIRSLSDEAIEDEINACLAPECQLRWRHLMLYHLLDEKLKRFEREN